MTDKLINPIVDEALVGEAAAILAKANAEKNSIQHAGMRGSASEALLRNFLGQTLPDRVGTATGMLYDHRGQTSAQTDIILFDKQSASLPPTVSDAVPCEAGLAAVEMKTTLRSTLIKKAAEDSQRIKLLELTGRNVAIDHGDGNTPEYQRVALPHLTSCTLFSIFQGSPLETVARYWQKHYYDVPFGCQLDYIVCLEAGVINLASWHPRPGRRRDQYSPVYYLHPGHCNPDGQSVLLFPDWAGKSKYPKRVRVGPRVPWAAGSGVFIGWTECGHYALGMWMKMLLEFISVQFAPSHMSSWGHFSDGLPPETTTIFLPVAIAVDPAELEKEGVECVGKAVATLLAW